MQNNFFKMRLSFLKHSRCILNQQQIIDKSFRRCIRGLPKRASKATTVTETIRPEPSIEEYEEKVDLSKFSNHLSTIARLALQNDPNRLKSINPNIRNNENGDLFVKNYKFTRSAQATVSKLEILNQKDTSYETITKEAEENQKFNEDPNEPISSVSCGGCGSKLHCQNKNIEGFMPASVFKGFTKKELIYKHCLRCDYLRTNKKVYNLTESSKFDYDKFLEEICSDNIEKKIHVILLVDLLDMPNSIYDGWSKLVQSRNVDIAIIGNKLDLLPDTGPGFLRGVFDCLIESCKQKGIDGNKIRYIDLISAKNGFNIEKLVSNLFKIWNDEGDVFLLGSTNAGKSVLFNQLLASDFCRTIASSATKRASTSFWPCTTLNVLKFPINFMNKSKLAQRTERLAKDRQVMEEVDKMRFIRYEKHHQLKDAELLGMTGTTFNSNKPNVDEIDTGVDATYSFDEKTGTITEGKSYELVSGVNQQKILDARELYRPDFFKNKSAYFHDTPGAVDTHEIMKYFSIQELQIATPAGIIMPRIYWMEPGQTMFISGLMRIDLIESTNNERVLFSIMASPALPVINPFKTTEADEKYKEYYEKGTVLRVPHKQHDRERPLPELVAKDYTVECIGNHKSMTDIVFSNYGWAAINSKPGITAKIKAYTIGGIGLEKREPSLLPFIVNMRSQWFRKDNSQAFKSKYYKKPKSV